MKTLIVVIHPNIKQSRVNARWINELKKYPERYDVHTLHEVYPDEKIDIPAEQKRMERYDKIVFQFSFYWYSCPPLLKKWLDQVLTYNWAYGSNSEYKLADKKIALAISVGTAQDKYQPTGDYKYTLAQLTSPFELTFKYVKANYRPFFACYGVDSNSSEEWVKKSVAEYLPFLENL